MAPSCRSLAPTSFAPFALALPRCLVSFDGCRFTAGLIGARVQITEEHVCAVFSDA
jgi:hypothetical protein